MKLKFIYFFLFALLSNFLIAQNDAQAKIYLKHYFDMYVPIQKDMWAFSLAVARDRNEATIENKRNELLNTLSHFQNVVKNSPNFNNDSALRLAVYDWLFVSKQLFKTDYLKIINLKPNAKQSVESMKEYVLKKEDANKKLQKANENLDYASELFANNNSLQIIEEETRIGTRIERINLAFKYYDNIYLLFYEAYIHEAKFNVAINSQDYNKVKSQLNQLQLITKNALKKIELINEYKGDPYLKYAAINILNSYQTMANSYGIQVLKFYQVEGEFNLVKKEIMDKTAEERTPEDVMKYNDLVKKRKELIPKFNENTQLFNQSRKRELADWNSAVEDFISKYAL